MTYKEILNAEAEAILNIPLSETYDTVIDLIVERVHRLGGKVIVSGMGKAGQIGMNIATTLSSTGSPAVFLHPAEAQHGDLGVMQPHDMLLLISNSGKTREVVELFELARGLNPDVPTVVITGDPASPLAELCDMVLPTGGAPEVCPLGLTPTVSTTVMTVIGDLIVTGVMKKINFTAHEYALRHHGGYLGKKSAEM